MLHFDIYIRGFGPGREPGAERLARAFGLPLPRARELVRSLPRVVKRGVPQAEIERYARVLDEIGCDCELRPSPIAPAQVIAIGRPGAAHEHALEVDGSALTLPPPRDEPVAVSRFAGTLVQPAGLGGDPNDTLRESHPPGSLVAPDEPVDQRAPDARILHVHAPTMRGFDTLTETPAPVPVSIAAPAPRLAAPTDRTQPEATSTPLARDFLSEPPARASIRPAAFSAPRAAPPAAPLSMPISAPVAPASIMPAPIVPERYSAPPPSEAWVALPAASDSADQLQVDWAAAGRPRVSSSRPPPVVPVVPLPPRSREAALRAETRPIALDKPRDSARPPMRPSARPAPMPAAERVSELPLWLRWTLRGVLGVALFVVVAGLRQCRALNDDVEQGLARWEKRPSAQAGSPQGAQAGSRGPASEGAHEALGPIASEWMRSDLNQFAGGDKDRARGLVQRFEAAGALSVHVATITELGMTRIAGELLVVLPSDASRRAAVLEVHQAMLRATFGGLAPPSRPDGDVLHVTL